MTRSIILAAASVAALAVASPAFAQDTAVVAAPVAASAAPVGGRIEVLAGYDRLGAYGSHKSGLAYGLGAGFDFAVGTTASLGIDAEIADSTAKIRGGGITVKASRDLYIGGRASFAVAPQANLYVKAGYTNARISIPALDDGQNFDGWRVGVGGQYSLNGKMYVGGEYRYSNYEHRLNRNQLVATFGTRF